mmetsp:Transcript_9670/g.15323  ORF Transcript_9670/g.15323 Transcript_9670/m.15323 type:complete len:94 (+) Transcript_9670:115-396(+)
MRHATRRIASHMCTSHVTRINAVSQARQHIDVDVALRMCRQSYLPHMGGGSGACGSSITFGVCLQLGEKVVDTSGSDWYSTAANITLSQSAAV